MKKCQKFQLKKTQKSCFKLKIRFFIALLLTLIISKAGLSQKYLRLEDFNLEAKVKELRFHSQLNSLMMGYNIYRFDQRGNLISNRSYVCTSETGLIVSQPSEDTAKMELLSLRQYYYYSDDALKSILSRNFFGGKIDSTRIDFDSLGNKLFDGNHHFKYPVNDTFLKIYETKKHLISFVIRSNIGITDKFSTFSFDIENEIFWLSKDSLVSSQLSFIKVVNYRQSDDGNDSTREMVNTTEWKFDKKGRLTYTKTMKLNENIVEVIFENTNEYKFGKLKISSSKTVYNSTKTMIEREEKRNRKGLVVKVKTLENTESISDYVEFRYKYSYDKFGNWIQKRVENLVTKEVEIEDRKIIYFR